MQAITPRSIARIEAFKVDLFCFDAIAFDIELIDGWRFSFCEQDEEWNSIAGLVETLPLLDSDWWVKVAFPAFDEKRIVIYDRSDNRTS